MGWISCAWAVFKAAIAGVRGAKATVEHIERESDRRAAALFEPSLALVKSLQQEVASLRDAVTEAWDRSADCEKHRSEDQQTILGLRNEVSELKGRIAVLERANGGS